MWRPIQLKNRLKFNNNNTKYTDGIFLIFTDGTHKSQSREHFTFKDNHGRSIKWHEIFAILLAIKFSLSLNENKFIIFTDSTSSMISIENWIKLVDTNILRHKFGML